MWAAWEGTWITSTGNPGSQHWKTGSGVVCAAWGWCGTVWAEHGMSGGQHKCLVHHCRIGCAALRAKNWAVCDTQPCVA